MAGPLRPRWVMRAFSRKAGGLVLVERGPFAVGAVLAWAMTSAERPERSHQWAVSSGEKTRGTRAGRVGMRFRPNWVAMSWPKPVAPILGMERPPVATTSAGAVKVAGPVPPEPVPEADSVSTRKWLGRETAVMRVLVWMVTWAAAHSSARSLTRSWAERVQKSWPRVFSW